VFLLQAAGPARLGTVVAPSRLVTALSPEREVHSMSIAGSIHMDATAQAPGRAILVADDEEELRSTISEYLQECGHEVLQAANGMEAVHLIEQGRCAAVVLDLVMPRLGGLDAIPRILKLEPSMPIVVVTGHPSPRAVGELEHWAVPLLAKPVNLPHLEALITRSLGASGAA
jgi:DNA-binding NtrC family response regulator